MILENKLGSFARSTDSGLEGVVVGHCVYAGGDQQLQIQPRQADDGSFRSAQWFAIGRVELNPTTK